MKLVVVESPSKAKTIEKYLGTPYQVVASVGHVRDLPKSNKKAVDIEGGFIPHYVLSPGKEDVVESIRTKAHKAEEVYLATDPDREGEAIAWHIAEAAHLKNPKRITFNEITREAVEDALAHPRDIDMNLKAAQEARRVLDRLVGYDLSGLIWKKVRYGLSAGRVQSPALRILVEREREIQSFVPEPFWIISGEFLTARKDTLTLIAEEEPKEESVALSHVEKGKKSTWTVESVTESEMKRAPKAPFTTSTLQQAASTRLGFSPSRTMQVAQKLYEAGHITYMRTDSTTLSQNALGALAQEIRAIYGEEFYSPRTFKTKAKNAQEAHEAIRPTKMSLKNAGTTDDQKRLYTLIRERTLASQMKDAVIMRTKIVARSSVAGIPLMSATGSRVLSPGWLIADPRSQGEETLLPLVKEGEELTCTSLLSEKKETTPPQRYSEAGLVKELEKRGIGRPSTYASIITTLVDREYVTKESRSLKPTDTGMVVSGFLEENFQTYISDTFTADMEDTLDKIAEGKADYEKTMKSFYTPFHKEVKAREKTAKITTLGEADARHICPVCGSGMVIKLGRAGRFLSCSRFPECNGALTLEGKEIPKELPLGEDPVTSLPVYVKTGRFGPYVQLGEEIKGKKEKPKRASVPKTIDPTSLTLEQALRFLSLPRELGTHPDGNSIVANAGRFGPYIVHNGDFRSLKEDDVYTISLERALEILKEPKKTRARKKRTSRS